MSTTTTTTVATKREKSTVTVEDDAKMQAENIKKAQRMAQENHDAAHADKK